MSDNWKAAREQARVAGEMLHQARIESGYTLVEVCNTIGTSWLNPPDLSRIERGIVVPSPEVGEKLSEWTLQHLPTIDPRDIPLTRRNDPTTSHEAAESVKPITLTYVRRWWLVHLEAYRHVHPTQATLEGIAGYHCTDEGAWSHFVAEKGVTDSLQSSQSGFRTRRSELVRHGMVEDSGYRVPIRSGRDAVVWKITKLGVQALEDT